MGGRTNNNNNNNKKDFIRIVVNKWFSLTLISSSVIKPIWIFHHGSSTFRVTGLGGSRSFTGFLLKNF